jgi:N-acyl homoserine lactone hydrolase
MSERATATRLRALHGGGEITTMSLFDPFHPEVGTRVEIPYYFYLVEHREGVVLFDTGGHPDLVADPRGRLGAAADAFEVVMRPGDDIVSKLATLGIGPDGVDQVVLSHLHYDHAGGIEFFPHAMFHVSRRELELARRPPVYQRDLYVPADFEHPVRWHEIDGDHDLFGDGALLIFPTPGHTLGHQSMLVKVADEAVILVGDAAPEARNMRERILPGIVAGPDAMVASWERIEQLQREHGAELLFTHDLGWPDARDDWHAG